MDGYDDNFTKTGFQRPPIGEAAKPPRVVEQGPRAEKPRRLTPAESAAVRRELGIDPGLPRQRGRRSSRPIRTSRVRRLPRSVDRQAQKAFTKASKVRNPFSRYEAAIRAAMQFANSREKEPDSTIPNGWTRMSTCSIGAIAFLGRVYSPFINDPLCWVRQREAQIETLKSNWQAAEGNAVGKYYMSRKRWGLNLGALPGLLPYAQQTLDRWTRTGTASARFPFAGVASPGANPNAIANTPGQKPVNQSGNSAPSQSPTSPAGVTPPPLSVNVVAGTSPARPDRFAPRARPRRRVRERKMLSRAAKAGILLYKILDELSEAAELVDAFFDALPEDVKKRWKRKDEMADQWGQYGLEGADYKLSALYHNWDKVDLAQAVKNVIKNKVEDDLIGAYQKHMPRNTVNAFDSLDADGNEVIPEGIVSQIVDDIFNQTLGW